MHGVTQWAIDGVAVCNAPGDQVSAAVHPDGAGGVIVAWEDFRDGQNSDLYVTRIDHNGNTGRVPVRSNANLYR